MKGRPYLLIQARVDESRLAEFERWYRETHIPRVLEIPGLIGCRRLRSSQSAQFMALYEFESEEAIQPALQSSQAQRAREQWRTWLPHVADFSIEIYAAHDITKSTASRN